MKTIALDDINKLPDRPMWEYQKVTPAEAVDLYHAKYGRVAKVVYALTWPGGRVDCFIPWEGER